MRMPGYLAYCAKKAFNAANRFFTVPTFSGNYGTWEEASKSSSGYNSQVILDKVFDASLKVKNGSAIYERDSVVFDKIEYSWPVLAALLWIASQNNKLNIVDFGGSFGSSYYQNRYFLAHLKEIRWNIVEQPNFVELGRKEFKNEHLSFYSDLSACYKSEHPEVILCSSVIQYLERPYDFIDKVGSLGFKYIIIDRTPFILQGEDRITVQKVPPAIYDASMPCWLLNLDKFKTHILLTYELIAEFVGFENSDEENLIFKGFIFRKRQNNIESV
jgi:putative methyltransferase (TIGR04325 family)